MCLLDDMDYGCLFCLSGKEDYEISQFHQYDESFDIIFPQRLRYNRHGGVYYVERTALFPGYLFFRCRRGADIQWLNWVNGTHKLLKNEDGDWQLRSSDLDIAKKLFSENGLIGFSKAYFEGDRIRIIAGFLKEYEGNIIRVNRRARIAQISVLFREKTMTMWLNYELIEPVA